MSDPAREVMDAERARIAATIARDEPALDRLLADELVYVHSPGFVDGKQAYIDRLCRGPRQFTEIVPDGLVAHAHDGCVVVNATQAMTVVGEGRTNQMNVIYLGTWVRRPEGWQLAAVGSTALPAAAN